MKRIALLCLGLAFGAVTAAQAQLTMQMSNGWSFTFAGNVNAFFTFEHFDDDGQTASPGALVPASGEDESRIRTGLLPAFAVFEAKGKEGETDILVHFGFAPQIQNASGQHDNFGNGTQAGAQIDMRQVFLTFGGSWGQILAGRELSLFQRQNILTDQTLFGIGGTGSSGVPGGGGGGTTLGRIGYGYIYPQFNAQITYSSPAGRPSQISIGLFEAASTGPYDGIRIPRVEAEFVYNQGNSKFWLGGSAQNTRNELPSGSSEKATEWSGDGGFRYGNPTFSITGSGYYGKGVGTTLLSLGGACSDASLGCGLNGSDDLRKSWGYIGQITVTPRDSKVTLAGSWGSSWLKESNTEEDAGQDFKTENTLASAGIYYQATKSLKVVGEFNYTFSKNHVDPQPDKNQSFAPAFGFMVFF